MIKKSLSDFASEWQDNKVNNINSNLNENVNKCENVNSFSYSDQSAEQTAEQIINKYSGYSKGELEGEIKERVASLKKTGQFHKQKLLSSFQMIEGFLSPEQRSQMLSMIEGLDE